MGLELGATRSGGHIEGVTALLRIHELKLPLDADESELRGLAARALKIDLQHITGLRIFKKSVDCRNKEDICFVFGVDVSLGLDEEKLFSRLSDPKITVVQTHVYTLPPVRRKSALRPIVVGFGPAGMFAALTLTSAGIPPLVLEQGEPVERRLSTVRSFWRTRALDPNSNVQFGEGGAGAFSDGKLNTGIKDPRCRRVLELFCQNGAPPEILYEAKPHIGTDRLAGVVRSIREALLADGAEIRFGARLTDLILYNGSVQGVTVTYADGGTEDLEADAVLLAVGHSARDTVELLYGKGLRMAQKPFSLGVRIEHRRELIDRAQYGKFAGHPKLGAADYKLSCHPPGGRGAYTFCMCPGGTVVCASSEAGGVVVNGMSGYARNGENSNSALLVGVEPESFPGRDPLAGMYWQREIERKAFLMGGGGYTAPAQKVGDFLRGVPSVCISSVRPTCPTGVRLTNLRELLPKRVTDTMLDALVRMDKMLPGFACADALLTAPETRSSSPVRILRDEFFQSSVRGIYPCGEGAGYAGGIVSAGVDGIRCAEAILQEE